MHLLSSSHPQLTMSSDNCAVGPDGKLLDKSEITWVHDPDDDKPMPPVTTSSTDQRQLSATTLDSFVVQVLPRDWAIKVQNPAVAKQIEPDLAAFRAVMWIYKRWVFDILTYFVVGKCILGRTQCQCAYVLTRLYL